MKSLHDRIMSAKLQKEGAAYERGREYGEKVASLASSLTRDLSPVQDSYSPASVKVGSVTKYISDNAGRIAMTGLGIAGTAAAVALGNKAVGLVEDAYKSMSAGPKRVRAYNEMMDVHDDLSEYPAKDVQRAFNSIYRFNPEVASEPLASGAAVRSVLEYGGISLDTVKNLVDMRSRPGPAGPGLIPEYADVIGKYKDMRTFVGGKRK